MRYCKNFLFHFTRALVFLLCIPTAIAGGINGQITDEQNEPLPFVSIIDEISGKSTTSNPNGYYTLELSPGAHKLVFRYIGYKTIVHECIVGEGWQSFNARLEIQTYMLESAFISGSGEDPAYAIIRKAQRKRKAYLNQLDAYTCDSYIKGLAGVIDAPEKVLGQTITLDGLDSSRSGIIYLSESVSKYYFQQPDKQKEIVISSKVSGSSQGFSWNSALEFRLNFYEPLIPTPITARDVISPISPTAFTYYKYKLEGTFLDNDILVYRIQVTPKITGSPLVSGIINIQDSTWRIHSVDMYITKENGIDFLDTLFVQQIYSPVTPDVWMRSSQSFRFNFNVKPFGIKGKGYFLGTFSHYNLEPVFEKGFFNGEVLRVEEESNLRPETYWDSIRPIPLTEEEAEDYEFKDSLEEVRETKTYQDSVDRIRNRFKPLTLITGYTYSNSWRQISFYISSPLLGFHFNTVEGIALEETLRFTKSNKKKRWRTQVEGTFRYGFDSRIFYGKGELYHRFNATNRFYLRGEGGKFIAQFNEENPISQTNNAFYSVFFEENNMKLFEKAFGKFGFGGEVFNGMDLDFNAEYAYRTGLRNATNLTAFYINWKSREFTSNNPLNDTLDTPPFNANAALTFDIKLNFTFAQKYITRPRLKINYPSKYPQIELYYKKGIPITPESPDFDFIRLGVHQEINTGILGNSEYYVAAGWFIRKQNLSFMDFHHFMTTRIAFAPENTLRSFWALPYYRYSTDQYYVEAHYQHHFRGWLFGKIPGFKKLKWQEVVGFHFLYSPASRDYYEFTVGIENIFRVFRVDVVCGFSQNQHPYVGGRLKIGL